MSGADLGGPPAWSPFVGRSGVLNRRGHGSVEVVVFGSRGLRACYG